MEPIAERLKGGPTPDWVSDCGTVVLFNGDCLEVLRELPAGVVDAVVTDPPYGIADHAVFVRKNCQEIGDGDAHWNNGFSWDWLLEPDWLRPGAQVASFAKREDTLPLPIAEWHRFYLVKPAQPPTPRPVFVSAVEQCLVGTMPGGRRFWGGSGWEPNYWLGCTPKRCNSGSGHECEKPIELITTLCRCLADRDAVVADPFMGSGTTGVAAVRLGQQFIGCELEPRWFNYSVKRITAELNRFPLLAAAESKPVQSLLIAEDD